MAIKIIQGILFNSKAQTLVNTINTVGVMGAGIALEFRLRYPEMYTKYVKLCNEKKMEIGKLWIYKTDKKWILNFPTKEDWKNDSKVEYLEKGLIKFINTYKEKGITSIAFPILGSRNGNIPEIISLEIMQNHLSRADIPIEIYKYDPDSKDELYDFIKNIITRMSLDELKTILKIQKQYAIKLINAFNNDDIKNINRLTSVNGIGIKTFEKVFEYYRITNDVSE